MSRRGGSEVIVIMWRDIPAQINGKVGADRHQVILPHRFQKAIDRAAIDRDRTSTVQSLHAAQPSSEPPALPTR